MAEPEGLRAAACFKSELSQKIGVGMLVNSTQIGLVPENWQLKLLGSPVLHFYGMGVPINQGVLFEVSRQMCDSMCLCK
jgi:hypothetical protein